MNDFKPHINSAFEKNPASSPATSSQNKVVHSPTPNPREFSPSIVTNRDFFSPSPFNRYIEPIQSDLNVGKSDVSTDQDILKEVESRLRDLGLLKS